MAVASEQHVNNIVVGAGEIFLDLLDADGNLQGERYLGDSVGMTLSITTERTTVWSGDGPVAVKLEDSVRTVERALGFVLHDASPENLALFALADMPAADIDDGAVRVTGAAAYKIEDVVKGRWYQLGATAAAPWGVRAIEAGAAGAVVTTAAAAPSQSNTIAAAAYVVDAPNARIFFKPSAAAPADGDDVWVHYTPAGAEGPVIRTSASKREVLAALRYIEDPSAGKGRNVYARRVSVAPSGEAALKSRDTEVQMQFSGVVLEPGGGVPALVIDGRET